MKPRDKRIIIEVAGGIINAVYADGIKTAIVIDHDLDDEVRNYYRHEECSNGLAIQWDSEWSCECDDECPNCGKDISPYKSKWYSKAYGEGVLPINQLDDEMLKQVELYDTE